MTEDPAGCSGDDASGDGESGPAGPPEEMSRGFYAALAVIVVLVLLIFTHPLALPTGSPQDPARGNWTLTSRVDTGGTLVPVIEGSGITARFDPAGGRMTGQAGCNGYSALYTTVGSSLSIAQVTSTKMACGQPGIMEQESAFLSGLGKVSSFRISGPVLTLFDAGGRAILVFTAAA